MSAPVSEGDVLAGKYRVDKVLGVGGMGVVVAATHITLAEKVALKFMLEAGFNDAEARERFLREARAARKLKSEHVARVFDVGTLENGAPYIVMEYLEGTDLSGLLDTRGRLSVAEVAEYVIQACDALAEAHLLGIVHRDLKPANLFLTGRPDGSPLVKVLDFGISKASALGEGGLEMTKSTAMMGSPLYMSPEQMKSSRNVDARADIWSLGVIVYQLLAGDVPFTAESLGELMSKVLSDPPPPLARFRNDVPTAVVRLVDGCLAKTIDQRVADVGEIVEILGPFAPSRAQPIVERVLNLLNRSGRPSNRRLPSSPEHTVALVPSPLAPNGRTLALGPPPGAPPALAPTAAPAAIATTSPEWTKSVRDARPTSARRAAVVLGAVGTLAALAAAGGTFVHRYAPARPAPSAALAEVRATATAVLPAPPVEPTPPASATTAPVAATPSASVAPVAAVAHVGRAGASAAHPKPTASAKELASSVPPAASARPPAPPPKPDDLMKESY